MATIFSKIVQGVIPCYKVAENEEFLAFLDINPIGKGHTLVIPKQEIDYIFDLPDDLLARMMVFAKKVGLAIERVVPCERIGIAVVGLEVPHAHIHLLPINGLHDLDFSRPKLNLSQEEFVDLASRIYSVYSN